MKAEILKSTNLYSNFYKLKINTEQEYIYGRSEFPFETSRFYNFTNLFEQTHPTYGKQLHFADYEQLEEVSDAVKFLSDNIKGIGKKKAETIVVALGDNADRLLLDNVELIEEVKLSSKEKEAVKTYFLSNKLNKEVAFKLKDLGLTINEAFNYINKLYEVCSDEEEKMLMDPVGRVKKNPYCLMGVISNIGYMKCSLIANKVGMSKSHPIRVEETLLYVLREAEQNGHSCLSLYEAMIQATILLGIPSIELESILMETKFNNEVSKINTRWELEETDVYLVRNHWIEKGTANLLYRIATEPANNFPISEDKIHSNNIILNNLQEEAVNMVFENKISILSGGPGTGKTTSLREIIRQAKLRGMEVKLCAPTGMAAKKMKQSTGEKATTNHKILEVDMSRGYQRFLRNQDNFIEADLLVMDETSMTDMFMFYNFIKAVNPKTRLLIVGDPDQLESVQAGKVLEDLIISKAFKHIHLEQIYRQEGNSSIVENAHRINNMKSLMNKPEPGFLDDWHYYEYFTRNSISGKILKLITDAVELYNSGQSDINPMTDYQVLLPRRQGEVGEIVVEQFNARLQTVLNPANPKKTELKFKKDIFRIGDKVMHKTNDPEKELSNGDIGYITSIDTTNRIIAVTYTEIELEGSESKKEIKYIEDEIESIVLAYCFTTHKSQGSEFPYVIVPLVKGKDEYMLLKKLVYTAITRAKKGFCFVGDINILSNTLYAREEEPRKTNLSKFIKEKFGIIENVIEEEKVVVFEEYKEQKENSLLSELMNLDFQWNA